MRTFRQFSEEKDKYVSTIKKQLKVPKKIWLGMPLLLSNVKLGKQKVTSPTMFYVKDFDDNYVTITNVMDIGQEEDPIDDDDPDGEIDISKRDIHGKIEVTMSKMDFEKLQEPQGMSQGQDAGGLGGLL